MLAPLQDRLRPPERRRLRTVLLLRRRCRWALDRTRSRRRHTLAPMTRLARRPRDLRRHDASRPRSLLMTTSRVAHRVELRLERRPRRSGAQRGRVYPGWPARCAGVLVVAGRRQDNGTLATTRRGFVHHARACACAPVIGGCTRPTWLLLFHMAALGPFGRVTRAVAMDILDLRARHPTAASLDAARHGPFPIYRWRPWRGD